MKNNIPYDFNRPLNRCEVGDDVVISVCNPTVQNGKFLSDKMRRVLNVPNREYKAKVVRTAPSYILNCEEQPLLSGAYTWWLGNKYHTCGIYADEIKERKYEERN